MFGRKRRSKGVRWKATNQPDDVSRVVARNFSHDTAVTQRILFVDGFSIHIDVDRALGCWVIGEGVPGPGWVAEWTEWWECYQTIARSLLAMPIPAQKQFE